ncbi:AAA family ATPase [Pelagibacterium flavum]|uniref:AAA family ATPase n=1 Tax=Pelagibacterium flavum TaxID=2984530 RepID=A0ABY6IU50_9HYPH|nr:AAA family ATPase [Pelagibacterium sp. YIM 151497]UYQ73964.1 AAA family ATPase [Pelagibacterium sp. YIM 151497]|tara:strand:+ start:196 stop:756 length:561 start_codon:yes stop_codon:yes gene_type:complete
MTAGNSQFPRPETLGPRICVFGPSNSGKSTLAAAIGQALSLPPVHLDLLHHQPNTDWVPRPAQEFERLHNQAIAGENWVMEGNYSRLMPQRLERATGIIWVDTAMPGNLWRYFRRTLFERHRIGSLEGGQDSLKWLMIHHIAFVQPRRRSKLEHVVKASGLPFARVDSMGALNRLYAQWGLEKPSA